MTLSCAICKSRKAERPGIRLDTEANAAWSVHTTACATQGGRQDAGYNGDEC